MDGLGFEVQDRLMQTRTEAAHSRYCGGSGHVVTDRSSIVDHGVLGALFYPPLEDFGRWMGKDSLSSYF